jgi:succinate dehydrogenase / fumarate reductase cytochrome b subunit
MLSSILHRASGCALAVGSLLLVWWLVAAASGPAAFAGVQWFMSSILGFLVLFGWTVALFFHLCSGLRHLVWDTGHGFDKVSANSGSYAVLVATAVLTILTWIVGLVIY